MDNDQLEKDGNVLVVFALALSQVGMAGVYSNATALMVQGLVSKTADPAVKGDLETMLAQVNDVTTWLRAAHQQLLSQVQELNLASQDPSAAPTQVSPDTQGDLVILH